MDPIACLSHVTVAHDNVSREALSEEGIKERIDRIQKSLKEGSSLDYADDQRVVLSLKEQALNVYTFTHNWLTTFLSVPNYGDHPDDAQKAYIKKATENFRAFQDACGRDKQLKWVGSQSDVGQLFATDAQNKNVLVNRIAQVLQGGDATIPPALGRLIMKSLQKEYDGFKDSMKSDSHVYDHFMGLEKEEGLQARIRTLILGDIRNANRPMIEALMMAQRGHNNVGALQLLSAQNAPSCAEGVYLRLIEGILVTQSRDAVPTGDGAPGAMNAVLACA